LFCTYPLIDLLQSASKILNLTYSYFYLTLAFPGFLFGIRIAADAVRQVDLQLHLRNRRARLYRHLRPPHTHGQQPSQLLRCRQCSGKSPDTL